MNSPESFIFPGVVTMITTRLLHAPCPALHQQQSKQGAYLGVALIGLYLAELTAQVAPPGGSSRHV